MLTALIPILTAILTEAPQVVSEIENVWKLLTATTAPTAAEQQAMDDALNAAHAALQAS
jgi:hypothetical protein